jgi:hypothetical protein
LSAVLLIGYHLPRTHGRDRTLWLGLAVLVAGGLAVTCWQLRGGFLANAYAGLALAWLMSALGARANQSPRPLSRIGLRLVPVALVALMPGLVGKLVQFLPGIPSANHDSSAEVGCDLGPAMTRLNQPPWVDQAPLLIAAPINDGARILWQSPHAVLAAPYHRNPEGIRDNELIMNGDEERAQAIAADRGVDFILLCPAEGAAYSTGAGAGLAARLASGEVPDWLEPLPDTGKALLLRRR